MNIIAIENIPSSQKGGKELSLLEVCHSLKNKGHQILLLHLSDGDLLGHYQTFAAGTKKIKISRFETRNVILSCRDFYLELKEVANFIRDLLSSSLHNSVIYLDQDRGACFAGLLAFMLKLPMVFHFRQPFFKDFPAQEKMAIQKAKKFIAVSEQTRKDWARHDFSLSKFAVIHNGTDTNRFLPTFNLREAKLKLNLDNCEQIISYIGRLDPEKGVDSLIKAFARLSFHQTRPVHLILAGLPVCHETKVAGIEYVDSLKRLSESLDIASKVHFLGHCNTPEELYHASDLTVLPSLNSEPFGRTIIESMSCGVPVIASYTGGIPEILQGEFISGLFEPGNVDQLAYKITSSLNWRQEDSGLGERCRAHVIKNFSLDKVVNQIEAVFNEICCL